VGDLVAIAEVVADLARRFTVVIMIMDNRLSAI